MRRSPLLLGAILFSACSPTNPTTGHWVGNITPTTQGPTCETSRAILDVTADGKVAFAPNEGTWILNGTLNPPGTIIATRSQPGADKRPFVTRLDATATTTSITGTYATPRCRFTVSLSQAPR